MGKFKIISKSEKPFRDRSEAAQLLAHELTLPPLLKPVILGIPRGGVIVAEEVAKQLGGTMDIVLTHKLGASYNPELAIGAVTESGKVFLMDSELGEKAAHYIEAEKARQLLLLHERAKSYRQWLPKAPLRGSYVIVVDDGVAMGFTMRAALWAAAQESPAKLIAAIPVGPEETVRELAHYADETICLRAPDSFQGVGQFYSSFEPVEDKDLLELFKNRREAS